MDAVLAMIARKPPAPEFEAVCMSLGDRERNKIAAALYQRALDVAPRLEELTELQIKVADLEEERTLLVIFLDEAGGFRKKPPIRRIESRGFHESLRLSESFRLVSIR